MRVQPGNHAGDGVVDELFLIDRLNVLGLDDLEDGAELLHLFNWQRCQRVARDSLQLHGGERACECAHGQDAGKFKFGAHVRRAFPVGSHVSGSIGCEACQSR
jgi:hypothetical protein